MRHSLNLLRHPEARIGLFSMPVNFPPNDAQDRALMA